MAGFFSVKLAPGLRVSASRRGLRAHVGPRESRLHVGGGGTGVSTGAGPFTYYTPVGGTRRRARRSYARGPTQAQLNRARKAEQAQLLAEALRAIQAAHRQKFAPAQRAAAAMPEMPSLQSLTAQCEREQLRGTRFWQWSARREAKQRAGEVARARAAELHAQAGATQRAAQDRIDAQWDRLLANEEGTVLATLAAAFEDSEAPVAPVGGAGGEAFLVVLVPGLEAVPERYPTVTDAGNLSIRPMTATARWAFYRQLVAGHALVCAREAFAVAPGLREVSVVVLRDEGRDVYGADRLSAILCTRLARDAVHGVRWGQVSAWDVVDQVGEQTLLETWGRVRELRPLDLSDEPELAHLVASVDLDDFD